MDATGMRAPEPDDHHMFNAIVSQLEDVTFEHTVAPEPARPASVEQPIPPSAGPVMTPETEPAAAPSRPVAPPAPQPPPSPPQPAPQSLLVADIRPERTMRDALVDWMDRRSRHKATGDGDSEITTGAFVTVCVITIAVTGLAFALSFDMMLVAARNYGWDKNLAKLFPIIIDVGAIGGTFMGAISANRVYRQIGHQVLVVTLAASVLFNLVGHDIKGGATLGLPEKWSWTGTVAAVLIPLLLAYFVHAFSKALKTFTDQRRAKKSSATAPPRPAATRKSAVAPSPALARPAPADTVSAKPAGNAGGRPSPKKPGKRELDKATALNWVADNASNAGPAAVQKHFTEQGYEVPHVRTLRRWLNENEDATT